MKNILYPAIIALTVASCVPSRKYEDLKAKAEKCETELEALKADGEKFEAKNKELSENLKNSQIERSFF